MSRVSLIEQLYAPKRKSALEFDYDRLWAPPIGYFLSQQDIKQLHKIATSLKYNDNIEKKYELIDAIMKPRGFKRGNCGTNRVVYNFLEDTSFCMKIALDRVGLNDSPAEFKNQEFFKPFCCKIFEVDPTGVIACVERVNPISSLEEFLSVSDDIFNMMVTKIIGKYVVDDLGTDKPFNYGIRMNADGTAFGPVVLDFPYAYELDGAKLHCAKPILIDNKEYACGGEIDYDAGLNNLVCCKCGRHYTARELAKDDSNVLKYYTSNGSNCIVRARIVRADGTIVKDSGRSSKLYMTKEQYEEGNRMFKLDNFEPRRVKKTIKSPYIPIKKYKEQYYSELQLKAYEDMQKRNEVPFNPVIEIDNGIKSAKRGKSENSNSDTIVLNGNTIVDNYNEQEFSVKKARRDGAPIKKKSVINNTEQVNDLGTAISTTLDAITEAKDDYVYESLEKVYDDDIVQNNIKSASETINGLLNLFNDKLNNKYESVESNDECDLNHELAQVVSEVIEETTNNNKSDSFNEKMESEVFPEINNNFTIGSNVSHNETDYSNYNPVESTESNDDSTNYKDDQYSKYYDERRSRKVMRKKFKRYDDDCDMSAF